MSRPPFSRPGVVASIPGIALTLLVMAGIPDRAGAEPPGKVVMIAGGGTTSPMQIPTTAPGIPAGMVALNYPAGVAVGTNGDVYIADGNLDVPRNDAIYRVGPDGLLLRIAGNGDPMKGEDPPAGGIPAIEWGLSIPNSVAFDSSGSLYVAEYNANRIRRIDPAGTITDVAAGELRRPYDVVADAAGNLYIGDAGNQRIVKRTPDGALSTVAGGGTVLRAPWGDGGSATEATLKTNLNDYLSVRLAIGGDGSLYLSDFHHHRVRKVTPDGIIQTVAGGGTNLDSPHGDGGSATDATLDLPQGIAIDVAGNLFIADSGRRRVRKVDAKGIISTVASAQDGLSAYNGVEALAIDAEGNLYIADAGNRRILKMIGVAAPGLLAGRPFPGSLPLVRGDPDRNGKVEIADAILALRIAAGIRAPTETQRIAGDVNGDGRLDLRDTTLILRFVVGLLQAFP